MNRLHSIVCTCFLFLTTMTSAQVPATSAMFAVWHTSGAGASAPTSNFTLRKQVEEVSVRFVAPSPNGGAPAELQPGDVTVFDDHQQVREFTSFSRAGHSPLRIGLVVDFSESIRPQQQKQMLSITDMLSEIMAPERDQAFLVGFSSRVELLQDSTSDLELIRRSLRGPHGPQGLTSLFDAVVTTCRDDFPSGGPEQRVMLLFTDGMDNLSIHTADDALQEALRAGVSIYAVTSDSITSAGLATLRKMTERTGGRVYIIQRKRRDYDTVLAGLSNALRNEYAVSFRPASSRMGFHPIQVRLPAGNGTVLKAASGYVLDPD